MTLKYSEDGSEVIRGFLEPELVKKYHDIAVNRESYTMEGEAFTGNTKAQYNGFNDLQEIIQPKVEEITGMAIHRTYNFFRIYMKGSYLPMHNDRHACEISVTVNLGGDDWKIGIKDFKGLEHEELLKSGDAMIYRGHDLDHWRPGIFQGERLVQGFFHFIRANGAYQWAKDDEYFMNEFNELEKTVPPEV